MKPHGEMYDAVELTGNDALLNKVNLHQQNEAQHLLDTIAANREAEVSRSDAAILSSEELLRSLGSDLPHRPLVPENTEITTVAVRSWDEIVREADANIGFAVSLADVLNDRDILACEQEIQSLRKQFDLNHRLDMFDWGIAGIAGTVAALVDIFLVQIPSKKGLLGGADTKGGSLSDYMRNHLKKIYSPEEIKALEKKYWVPYDAATSKNLKKKVAGLGPRSHRYQSLGHDPLLGFVFGVADIMKGRFTAIDKAGKIIVQTIPGANDAVGLFEAIAIQIGHLKSDIGTPAGLPAPFMPLLQLMNFGSIGDKGRTVGELSRAMYASGYDFGHFLAMSIPVMIIEVLVRLFYFLKRRHEGHSLIDSLPLDLPGKPRKPKLQTMLFTAHTIATAANAGKVYFTGNPLSINFPQWLWYAKSTYQQIRWSVWSKENERLAIIQQSIDDDWQHVNDALLRCWRFAG